MESLRELYKIGVGPSSSHTMGPQRAAQYIKEKYPDAHHIHVDLHGSLALTGKGHLTDYIIEKTFADMPVSFSFQSKELPMHPNGMIFHVYDNEDHQIQAIEVYSIGEGLFVLKIILWLNQNMFINKIQCQKFWNMWIKILYLYMTIL